MCVYGGGENEFAFTHGRVLMITGSFLPKKKERLEDLLQVS